MLRKLFLFFGLFIFVENGNGQNSLELITKYIEPEAYAYFFFSGKITEDIAFYRSLELIQKSDQLEYVEINYYNKYLRTGRAKVRVVESKLSSTYRQSIWAIPKRIYFFLDRIPTMILYGNYRKKRTPIKIQHRTDSLNRIISSFSEVFRETYQYNGNNDITFIHQLFLPEDTTYGVNEHICYSKKIMWGGKYDQKNLVEETINWDGGKKDINRHKWENGFLIETLKEISFEDKVEIVKYYYENNLLVRIESCDESGKLLWKQKFKWKYKNNA